MDRETGQALRHAVGRASNPKAVPEKWENKFVFGPESCDIYAAWLGELVADSITHLEQTLGLGSGSDVPLQK
jgi:hypothetical protein